MHPATLIQKKRDGGELSVDEIRAFVAGVTAAEGDPSRFGDAQLGAFLMAVCCRGMTVAETGELTLAMRDSGRVLDLSSIAGIKVDKHSTGGVGDKVSLLLAPLVAAAGIPIPMISGRGLGHTGGTIDKLQSIPGYRTDLDERAFMKVLEQGGFVMAGASAEIAPADRRMYATRDVSGTVESIPLITASILSKKLAEGLDALVLDVKCGRAAFMKSREDATTLMDSLVETGRAAGKEVHALLTDMDTPLGLAIGNALEIREILDALHGRCPPDLWEVTKALGVEMLLMGGKATSPAAAEARLEELLTSGAALACFVKNLELQGGDTRIVEDPSRLPAAPCDTNVLSPRQGFVADWDPMALGLTVVDLGGGRRQPTDDVDPGVGIVLRKKVGDPVARGEALATVHARNTVEMQAAVERIIAALRVSETQPAMSPVILDRR